ncbi:MAG: hypothetical protein KGO81_06830 [Bacteroidota bacterium]|nr:hypothetical protein [Bacteroidota bacterium]
MKKLIFLLGVLFSVASYAQVGIGTNTPNASAKLDVTSTNKGFLPPRIALTGTNDVATITSPATGLLVYNTATVTGSAAINPGLYYYNGTSWQRVINQQNNGNLVITSSAANTSGLQFSNLTSTTPVSSGATLGVDANGNVVTVQGSSFSPSFGSSRISGNIYVNGGSTSLLTSITFPTTGTYLVTYTMRVQSVSAVAGQFAVGYLSNSSTPGSPIAGTEILGGYTQSAIVGGNYSGSYIVTVTSANTSLYFFGSANSGGGQQAFLDDANGRTSISYVKVTP